MTSRMTRAPIAPITLALSLAATMATAQPATYKIAFIDPLFGPFADVGELMLMLMQMQYAIRNTPSTISARRAA